MTPSSVPDAPTAVSAEPGNAQATLSFEAPFDEGSTITGYGVVATDVTHPGNGGQTATGTSSPITVTGLTNGDSYTFTVSATNGNGKGAASAPSASVTPTILVPLAVVAPSSLTVGAKKAVSQVVKAKGTPTGTITAKMLPSWLTLAPAGEGTGKKVLLVGTAPAAGGAFTVTLVASNGIEAQAEQSITINVLAFTSPNVANFTAQQPGSFTVTTSDTPANPTLSATGLPKGLSFTDNGDGTGTITGTPDPQDGEGLHGHARRFCERCGRPRPDPDSVGRHLIPRISP